MTQKLATDEHVADRSMTWTSGHWVWVVLILLAFSLRVHDLGRREFWFDEALTANVSGLGWEGAITHVRTAPFEHPPLYFLSLYPWQQLAGTSEFAFRFYSLFWGVLFVPLLYVLIRRLANERLGRVAALLATISPFMVAYSQEARMYTLLPCLALLVLLAFHNAVQSDGRPRWWLVYTVLMAMGVATHYYFALIWVATAVYLVLDCLHRRKLRWLGIALQALLPLAAVTWLLVAPGLRDSLARLWQGEAAFSLAYKLDKVMPTLMLADVGGREVPLAAHVLAAGGWMLALVGVWWSRRAQVLSAHAWRLLMLFLVVPLTASLLLPYGVLGRHLGYTLIALFTFMALGLLALGRRGRSWLAVGILALLLFSTYGLAIHLARTNGDFARAMAYIDERGQPGDLVVLSQPGQHPLETYYNDQNWPVRYLPSTVVSLTPDRVAEVLRSLTQARDRMWLGPIGAWTADPERLIEQWLTANAFQAEKTWFPDSSSVALYITDDEGLAAVEMGRLIWGGRIRLESLTSSTLQVAAGDALRLRFHWRAGIDLDERYMVRVSLVDDQGLTWAERHGEPCGGWCPTDTWEPGNLFWDQHALVIPPGTPPGAYRLQVAWLPLDGGPALQAEEDGQLVEHVTLAPVMALPPRGGSGQPWTVPNPLQATFGGEVTLLGYQPAAVEARLGEVLRLETHWRAETAPSGDHDLLLELVDRRGRVVASWQPPPSAGSYPTRIWQRGEYLRGKQEVLLPSSLPPGRYWLRIALVNPDGERLALTGQILQQALDGLVTWHRRLHGQDLNLFSIRIFDRTRQFKLPSMEHVLEATVGRHGHLVGYDLDLSQAYPGGQVLLTLFWQAGGPMVRPFKVFTHLIDADNTTWAQHDAPPGEGCCPANTWIEGEVIVDQHPIRLGADLTPGIYQLVVGMYDEETASRLPAYDANGYQLPHDRVQISGVTVQPASATGQEGTIPTGPKFDSDYVIYLPLLQRMKP